MPNTMVAIFVGKTLRPGVRHQAEAEARVKKNPGLAPVLDVAKTQRWMIVTVDSPNGAADWLKDNSAYGCNGTFILLDTESFDDEIEPHVRALCKARENAAVRLVVYAKKADDDGEIAVKCLIAGAKDYLVRDYPLSSVERRITAVLGGTDANQPFADVERFDKAEYIFVATPFCRQADLDYLSINAGLAYNAIRPLRGDGTRSAGDLRARVEGLIRGCKLVIANITRYPDKDIDNVFYEIGFATASFKKVILVQKGETALPALLSGWQCLYYVNRADLAGQLYRSLAHCSPNGDSNV